MSDALATIFSIELNGSTQVLQGFDPARGDQLDVGEISVHGLILGQLADGTAIITSPWNDSDYIVLEGVRWSELSTANFAPVGNEHLRQDIGGVLSWEQNLGPREADTIYLRSHEYSVHERVENFDPQSQKLSFLYFGSRERLSVDDTSEGLLISSEPSGQSVLLVGVQRTDLVAANLEFHHDQVMEDNLEEPFGFSQDAVSLVSRAELFTPPAPAGASTDGEQVRSGDLVQASEQVVISAMDHTAHDHTHTHTDTYTDSDTHADTHTDINGDDHGGHSQMSSASGLELEVSGSLYWGGMGGTLTVTNTSTMAVEDWSVSFLTHQQAFQSWAGEAVTTELDSGLFQVTLSPASWNRSIAAGASLAIDFNATSVGLPNSGELTAEQFFAVPPEVVSADPLPVAEPAPIPELAPSAEPTPAPTPQPDPSEPLEPGVAAELEPAPAVDPIDAAGSSLSLQVELGDHWSGAYAGTLLLTNTTGVDLAPGWSISFISDDPLRQLSNFSFDQQQLADGRYSITVQAASWAADQPLRAGASLNSYFQASGDLAGRTANDLFAAEALVPSEMQPLAEAGSETSPEPSVEPEAEPSSAPELESPASSEPTTAEESAPDPVVSESDPVELDPAASGSAGLQPSPSLDAEGAAPTPTADASAMRVVGYFEEWGIYSRDFRVADVNAETLTHLNYSFFDVTAAGELSVFDSFAATEKRFSADQQVSRTFTAAEWQALDEAQRSSYTGSDDFMVMSLADGSTSVSGIPQDWNTPGALAGNLRQFDLLKQLNPELQLGLALGGWTLSDEFSLAVASEQGREALTDSIISTLETYDFFNVIDFDWEYPGGGGASGNAVSSLDGINFASTLSLLRQKLDGLELATGEDYEISIATAGGYDKLANLNLEGIDPFVDFYNVMSYDFHGGWESTTGHQAAMTADPGGYDVLTAVAQFDDAGVDRSKVVLGAPAYTRAWGGVSAGDSFGYGNAGDARLAPGSFEPGNYDSKDILTGVAGGDYQLIWDDTSKAGFAYNADDLIWSSIETSSTIAGKASYVQEAGLGGMMFWALSNDAEGDQSLVAAANDVLRGGVAAEQVAERAPQFDAVLGGDGVFAMQDFTGLA